MDLEKEKIWLSRLLETKAIFNIDIINANCIPMTKIDFMSEIVDDFTEEESEFTDWFTNLIIEKRIFFKDKIKVLEKETKLNRYLVDVKVVKEYIKELTKK